MQESSKEHARHGSVSSACSGHRGAHLVHKDGPGDAAPPHVALVWQRAVVRHDHHLDLRCALRRCICASGLRNSRRGLCRRRAQGWWHCGSACAAARRAARRRQPLQPCQRGPAAVAQRCVPVVSQCWSWPTWNAQMQHGQPRSSTQCTLCLEPSYAVHMLSQLLQSRPCMS
jgi:hypothetical protein